MKVHLLRHAIAVPRGTPGFAKDADRPLTIDGRKKLQAICRGIKYLDPDWELIITSPFLRAKQTAQIVSQFFEMENLVEESFALTPRHDTKQVIEAIQSHPRLNSVLLVGHEPSLSEHLSYFVAGNGRGRFELKKAGWACVEFEEAPEIGQGTLQWLMTPAQMMRLGKKKS